MHISRLCLVNYGNFPNAKLIFRKGVKTVIGENGSGKTNLFRAIRLLLDDNMIRFANRLDERISIAVVGNGKVIGSSSAWNSRTFPRMKASRLCSCMGPEISIRHGGKGYRQSDFSTERGNAPPPLPARSGRSCKSRGRAEHDHNRRLRDGER